MKDVLRRQVALAGRVLDAGTGRPLADAPVELAVVPAALTSRLTTLSKSLGRAWDALERRPDRTRTDASGRFTFLDLPSGAYTLAASYPQGGRRYGTIHAKATVKRNRAGDVTTAWVDLSVPATTVAGTVSGPDAKPVGLAAVRVKGGHEVVYTDGRGRYSLTGLESGARTLVVSGRGFKAAEQEVQLADPGSAKTVNVTLAKSP